MNIKLKTRNKILKGLFFRRPKVSIKEIAETIYAKLFREEVRRTVKRIRNNADDNQMVEKEKLNLIIIALFVFIVDYSTVYVYGNSKLTRKILAAFYMLIRQEFREKFIYIIETAQRFAVIYKKKPDDPLFGLGLSFSRCVNNDNRNFLTAMAATTETVKKFNVITCYYQQLNKDYRIC